MNEYQKKYYNENKEQIRAKQREYYQKNKDKILQKKEIYRDKKSKEIQLPENFVCELNEVMNNNLELKSGINYLQFNKCYICDNCINYKQWVISQLEEINRR